MNVFGLLIALFLPALLGVTWVNVFWKNSHLAARVGYGYLLGIFAVTVILQIWSIVGLPLDFRLISTFIIVLAILPVGFTVSISSSFKSNAVYRSSNAHWQKIIWGIVFVLLTIRFGQLLQEIVLRPLYPWDAWMNWAPKAKAWFYLKEIVPFVSPYLWATHDYSQDVYTLANPDAWKYPPLVPLIQTWTALGMGKWIDNFVNIPWAMCLVALGLSIYGQGRMLGAKPHFVLIAVYILFSLPFVYTHSVLAGYADIWLASYLTLAGMAFINWSQTGNYRQAVILLLSAVACTQTKIPGVMWVALFIPASLFVFLPKRWSYLLILMLILGAIWLLIWDDLASSVENLLLTPQYIDILGMGRFLIEYHDVSEAFYMNYLLRDNWNLFGWLLIVVIPASFYRAMRYERLIAPSVLIVVEIVILYAIFFYTKHYLAAVDGTTINRATLHIVPLLLYYVIFIYSVTSKRERI